MGETSGLVYRALATVIFDCGLVWTCGLLLAQHWLRRMSVPIPAPRIATTATLMLTALCAQFILLTRDMADTPTWAAMRESIRPVAHMHAGRSLLLTFGAAALLLIVSFIPARTQFLKIALVLLILAFHSAVGHAAAAGDFSRLEILQFVHLNSMALWSGGVIVSGLWVVPHLVAQSGQPDRRYLRALSITATWSVIIALITGAIKGWIGLDGNLHTLISGAWGWVLSVKILLVCIALVLGYLHRRWISRRGVWTIEETGLLLTTLRAEAMCLTLVIVLSGFLSNISPD